MNEHDRFFADMADSLADDMLDDLDAIGRSVPDPDTEPDPEYADMSAFEREQALDEYWIEEANAQAEAEFMRLYPGIL